MQGNLTFSTIEPVLAQITDEMDKLTHLTLDFRRMLTINECSCRLIHLMMEKLLLRKHPTLLVNAGHVPLLRRFLKAKLEERFDEVFLHFDDLDFALEWCEERVLKSCSAHTSLVVPDAPVGYDLLEGLTEEEILLVQACLQRQRFVKGE